MRYVHEDGNEHLSLNDKGDMLSSYKNVTRIIIWQYRLGLSGEIDTLAESS
jgi:hypothetical protein